MEKVRLTVEVEALFHSYGTKAKDRKARNQIKRWIRDVLENEALYIPLYIEDQIEDSTKRLNFKVLERAEYRLQGT